MPNECLKYSPMPKYNVFSFTVRTGTEGTVDKSSNDCCRKIGLQHKCCTNSKMLPEDLKQPSKVFSFQSFLVFSLGSQFRVVAQAFFLPECVYFS